MMLQKRLCFVQNFLISSQSEWNSSACANPCKRARASRARDSNMTTLRMALLRRLITNERLFINNNPFRVSLCSSCSLYENRGDNSSVCPRARGGVIALDCEMLSCRPTKKWFLNAVSKERPWRRTPKEVSVAAHCALVDYDFKVVYETRIWPGDVAAAVTNWKGVRPGDLVDAPQLNEARGTILWFLRGKLVVANDIRHDLAALQIHLGRHLPRDCIRDTSTCAALRRIAGIPASFPWASLRDLARGVLGRRIQAARPHSPVEDAAVAMELYKVVEKEWEREKCSEHVSLSKI